MGYLFTAAPAKKAQLLLLGSSELHIFYHYPTGGHKTGLAINKNATVVSIWLLLMSYVIGVERCRKLNLTIFNSKKYKGFMYTYGHKHRSVSLQGKSI